jgi:hypothetical protein
MLHGVYSGEDLPIAVSEANSRIVVAGGNCGDAHFISILEEYPLLACYGDWLRSSPRELNKRAAFGLT